MVSLDLAHDLMQLAEPASLGLAGLGVTLLILLWQGTLVGGATAIALRLAGAAASHVRYRLALGALALIAVAPFATVARQAGVLGDWGLVTPGTIARSPADRSTTPTVAATGDPALQAASPIDSGVKSGSPTANLSAEGARDQSSSRHGGPLAWLGAVWLAGVALLLARLASGIVQVHRLRAGAHLAEAPLCAAAQHLARLLSHPRHVPILWSDRADTPCASGVRRPAVVLPTGLAADLSHKQLQAILAHELAHVRRHDYAVNLGQRVLEALFWFHPAIHWLSRVARDEREHCCDELAAAVVGDRRAVAGALLALEVARGGRRPGALLPTARGGSLLRRVERLLALVPVGGGRWTIAAAVVLFTSGGTMVLATPASSAAPEALGAPPTPGVPPASMARRVNHGDTGVANPSAAPLEKSARPAAGGPGMADTVSVNTPRSIARDTAFPASTVALGPGPVVWAGNLGGGERLRVRNLVGSIRVVRASGAMSVVRAHLPGVPLPDLTFQLTREDDGVTVCAVRARYGRCDAEGSTWFGAPDELSRARIDLTVELPRGVSVTAATFHGDLDLDGIDADAEARTGSGMIELRIADSHDGFSHRTLDLHTGAGTVRVALSPLFGGELDVRISGGQVQHEVPLEMRGARSPQRFQASLGPGDNRLRVSTGRGDLVLTRS